MNILPDSLYIILSYSKNNTITQGKTTSNHSSKWKILRKTTQGNIWKYGQEQAGPINLYDPRKGETVDLTLFG